MKKITLFFALLLFTALNYMAQAAESQTAACTAGNLATVAASYLTTVTNLTVTGTIDARDFKTMRDAMPLLEVIDLSGVTIADYNGKGGTKGTTSTAYPANEVPTYAFYNPLTYIGKVSLKEFSYPSLVTTIGNNAFHGCTGFTGSLTISSTVTTIGFGAFGGCTGFTGSLTIPSSVTTIEGDAFYRCTGFTGSLTIPSSTTTIGDYAFEECSGFTGSLTIPSSVTTIGTAAFEGCTGFTSIFAHSSTPIDISANYYVFNKINKMTCILHVPAGSIPSYELAYQWQDFTNIVDDIVATSAYEVLDSKTISIFPNPATSTITISELGSLEGNQNVTVSIVDVLGNALMIKELKTNVNSLSIDVSALKKGIYFINMQTSNGNVVKRFVKE